MTGDELRAVFDAPARPTIGLEEEVMLLDAETFDLAPRGAELLDGTGEDAAFKLELPAAQLEIAGTPAATVGEAIAELVAARRRLAAVALARGLRLAAAGTHPFASAQGPVSPGERYAELERDFGAAARRQLVWALQVHVAIRGADRALAVYHGLRTCLPEIAALAANAPFHAGRDTGRASARPGISAALPRQGLPPEIDGWHGFARELDEAGATADRPLGRWWWELRPNPAFGTLEVRVPDAQSTVEEAAGVAALVQCLAVWLADCWDTGESPARSTPGALGANRAAAIHSGLDAVLTDPAGGPPRPARERLEELIERLAQTAERLGCRRELAAARAALSRPAAAQRQREVAAQSGLPGLVAWLADRFLEDV